MLYEAQARWGLDVAQMLVGSESMFNRYLSERNLNKLLAVLESVGDDAEAFRTAVVERLAALTSQILSHEKEDEVHLEVEPKSAFEKRLLELLDNDLSNKDHSSAHIKTLTRLRDCVADRKPLAEIRKRLPTRPQK